MRASKREGCIACLCAWLFAGLCVCVCCLCVSGCFVRVCPNEGNLRVVAFMLRLGDGAPHCEACLDKIQSKKQTDFGPYPKAPLLKQKLRK